MTTMNTVNIPKNQLLSPADGNVMETLTDPRVLATAGGVVAFAAGEHAVFRSSRAMFGVAATAADGKIVYYEAKDDGTADTSKPHPQFQTNRNVARMAGVVGCIATIEYTNNGPIQYALLGGASVLLAHILQDAVPALR